MNFNHRSVFPVLFDGAAVERWWKYALDFKVFARQAGQNVVCILLTLYQTFLFLAFATLGNKDFERFLEEKKLLLNNMSSCAFNAFKE